MKKSIIAPVVALVCLVASITYFSPQSIFSAKAFSVVARPAPEFTQTDPDAWLGSEPLSIADLRGNVVLIDFWTYGCWNCYRSFPWLNDLEARLKNEKFRVIGIHTPEFEREKVRENVVRKIDEFELKHPSMMDNDFAYWKKIENRYWPTYYLIDKRGFIRHVFIGETHADTDKAQEVETAIRELLAEQA